MIFNAPVGGSAYIVISAPVGSDISANLGSLSIIATGTGPYIIEVPSTGIWAINCIFDGVLKTQSVNISSFGNTYSTTFTYSATITISCPSGASIVASMSGYSNVTRIGPGSISVPKKGTWSIACTWDGTTYTNSVNVQSYESTYTTAFTYSSTITISCPSGASIVASMSGYSNVTRIGPGSISVPKKGTWSIACTWDGTTYTNSVNVSYYGSSYTTSFTYSCTITINCPSGTSIVASMSGYSNVTRTGPGSITVPKKGSWSVTGTINSGTVVSQSKTVSASATYGSTTTINIYPKFYIYFCNKGSGNFFYGGSFTHQDSDGTGTTYSPTYSYGSWKIIRYTSTDSGNNILRTNATIPLTGYSSMKIICRKDAVGEQYVGLSSSGNFWAATSWEYRTKLSASNGWSDGFITYTISFSSTASLFAILRNIAGSGKTCDMEIQEWWLE